MMQEHRRSDRLLLKEPRFHTKPNEVLPLTLKRQPTSLCSFCDKPNKKAHVVPAVFSTKDMRMGRIAQTLSLQKLNRGEAHIISNSFERVCEKTRWGLFIEHVVSMHCSSTPLPSPGCKTPDTLLFLFS